MKYIVFKLMDNRFFKGYDEFVPGYPVQIEDGQNPENVLKEKFPHHDFVIYGIYEDWNVVSQKMNELYKGAE